MIRRLVDRLVYWLVDFDLRHQPPLPLVRSPESGIRPVMPEGEAP